MRAAKRGTDLNHEDTKDTKVRRRFERDRVGAPWSNLVIGAAIEVHRVLGPGFLESVYEAALCVELEWRGIPFVRQAPVRVHYKGHDVGEGLIDVLVGGALVVELKTVDAFSPLQIAQVISYLQAIDQQVGLLLNFKVPVLGTGGLKRILRT